MGVECEIAVRLAKPLPADRAPYDRASVAGAVGAGMAAIEVVDDRYEDYRSLDTPTLIADDFFNAACVLGAPVERWRELDLASVWGRMRINGSEVGSGRGGDILGHPLEALAWLANALAARGRALAAGDFVLLGSVVETKWVAGRAIWSRSRSKGWARRAVISPSTSSRSTGGHRRAGCRWSPIRCAQRAAQPNVTVAKPRASAARARARSAVATS